MAPAEILIGNPFSVHCNGVCQCILDESENATELCFGYFVENKHKFRTGQAVGITDIAYHV